MRDITLARKGDAFYYKGKHYGADKHTKAYFSAEHGSFLLIKKPRHLHGAFLLSRREKMIDAAEFVRPTVINHPHGYVLPDLPMTPVDEWTGLPWCFAPNPDLPLPPAGPNFSRKGDWNHLYPKVEVLYGGNPVLEGLGRMALVNLRHQWVAFNDHHEGYNPNFIGPMQPATRERLASVVVMGLAKYVPEYAIDFSSGRPQPLRLSPRQRQYYWESGQLKIACEGDAVGYLFEHVLSQEVDHIREGEIDEFLHTFDLDRRIHLGHCLAAKIIERAVEPVESIYAEARKRDLLPGIKSPVGVVRPPRHPRDLVKYKIASGRRFGRFSAAMQKRLGLQGRLRRQAIAA